MTQLVLALQALGAHGEIALAGRWVALHGPRCMVYVAEMSWGSAYWTWCDHPTERAVEVYDDPAAAIRAGLRRAARPQPA